MKIILHDNFLGLRGTTVALYDYAFFLKKNFNYNCCISYNNTDHKNELSVIKKFKAEFELLPYNNFSDLDTIVKQEQVDLFYTIKAGDNDGRLPKGVKTAVHAVFPCSIAEKHGDVYAYVSEWLSNHCSNGSLPYVPHMVNLPITDDNYRTALNIPKDAIVFGRYGGLETFDIPFAANVINNVINTNPNIYFIFCNTYKFIDHPRVIFTNGTASLMNKVMFINTCDALLHARMRGETFGLTVLEFMSKNKPVITYSQSEEKNHYSLLGADGLYYKDEDELYSIIMNFSSYNISYPTLNEFLPEKVIQKFNKVFIKN